MQRFFRQLRWQIVAAHMAVVITGVVLILLMTWLVTFLLVPADVAERLVGVLQAQDPDSLARAQEGLLDSFRRSILTAVSIAALGAVFTGIMTSLLLVRQILRPLQELARSSERIARGHFHERISIPASDELAEVATNFNQMAESLEQVEQRRVLLIGNVSHELRTPLTGLNGYLEGLMDGVFAADEETLAMMHQEVRRLRRLVDDLQALSRVEAGQIQLQPASFNLVPVARRLIAQLLPQAEAGAIQLDLQAPAAPVTVYADEDRTAQVLLNLLGNALRYTPAGGTVQVVISAADHHAVVAVEDNGIGIPGEALPLLFERFYRVDASRTRQSGGSGIGLTISRHLVWAMGGELTAASPGEGKGSTFTFTLPLAGRHQKSTLP